MKPQLDPWRFDELTDVVKLWGSKQIARALGVSEATVRRWAEEPETPIYKPSGRYFAFLHELEEWLKSKG